MTIPQKIKIGGLTYKVVIDKKLVEEHDCVGRTDSDKRIISLQAADQQSMECTFIHEMLHGINCSIREETIEFLAQMLYQIIVDNPVIFKK